MRKYEEKEDVNRVIDLLKREIEALKRVKTSTFVSFGATTMGTSPLDRWLNPLSPSVAVSSTEMFIPAPRSGVIKSLSVHVPSLGTAAADRTVTFTVRRKSVDTTVKAQCTVPRFTGVASSRSEGAVKVEQGDLLSVIIRKSGVLATAPGPIIAFVEIE